MSEENEVKFVMSEDEQFGFDAFNANQSIMKALMFFSTTTGSGTANLAERLIDVCKGYERARGRQLEAENPEFKARIEPLRYLPGRVLTLQVKVVDSESSDALLCSLHSWKPNSLLGGCRVTTISFKDDITELAELKDTLFKLSGKVY